MKPGYLLAVICLATPLAHAEIYKAVDANGHVTYSSTPIKGGKKIVLEPLPAASSPSRAHSATSPEGFPKVDGATQKGRDDTRRRILQDELITEEKLLQEARQSLKEGEANPGVGKDGKISKREEKIRTLKDQVDLHSQNVEALKIELSKLK